MELFKNRRFSLVTEIKFPFFSYEKGFNKKKEQFTTEREKVFEKFLFEQRPS